MYKPVPVVHSQLDSDDSECESMLRSVDFDVNVEGNEDVPEHAEIEKTSELSPARKIAFILSILNCIAFVVVFLWILPCDYDTCHSPVLAGEKEWTVDFTEEGTWLLQIAPAPSSKAEDIVIVANSKLYSNMLNVSSLCMIGNSTDIVGVRAVDGKVLWRYNSSERVDYLNCSLIDLNNDGVSDCLMYDQCNGFRAFCSQTGSLLWKSSWSIVGYDLQSIMIEDVQAANLDTDSVSDLLILLTDADSFTLVGISGKGGDALWQHRLHANCSLVSEQLTISEVLSAPLCLNATDLKSVNIKQMTTEFRVGSAKLEVSKCEKCAPLIAGVPASRYVLHKDYLVVANVNCSVLQTQLKKTHV